MKPDFPPLALMLFFAVTGFLFILTVMGLGTILKRVRHPNYTGVLYMVALGILGWLLLTTFLSLKGFFANFTDVPPRVMLLFVVAIGTIVTLAVNKSVGRLLDEIPPQWLIYPQAFRIVVEIVLWLLFLDKIAPEQMTFEGMNFDIVAGITAPIIAFAAYGRGRKNRMLALVWNFLGLALLLNILTVAVLSIPQIGVISPPNTFVAYWPLVWLPAFVAPWALMLHVMSIRQLLRQKS